MSIKGKIITLLISMSITTTLIYFSEPKPRREIPTLDAKEEQIKKNQKTQAVS